MFSSLPKSASQRYSLFFAAATVLSVSPALAAENKGMVHRVTTMEECIYGCAHKERPLHERITQLESQTIGAGQSGALSKRLEELERVVNGKSLGPTPSIEAHRHGAAKPKVANAGKKPAVVAKKPVIADIEPMTAEAKPMVGELKPMVAEMHPVRDAKPTVADKKAEIDKMLREGTASYTAGKTDEAEKVFKQVLVMSPFNTNASFNLGAIAECRGDLPGALGNYRTALIGAPNDPQIQSAIAQIESQIAQKQDSPFRNPLVSTATGGTMLRGNASEFDPLAGQAAQQVPQSQPLQASLAGNALQPAAQRGSGWRTAGALGATLMAGAARGAVNGAMRGGGGAAMSGALGGVLGGLHCPICRLLH